MLDDSETENLFSCVLMSRTLMRIQEEIRRIREDRKSFRRPRRDTASAPSASSRFDLVNASNFFELAEQRSRTADRCRPRIPHVFVSVHDRSSRTRSHVDVAYLQDYGDRFAALRELIRIQFNSVTDIFHKLDKNGNGKLTVPELMDCLTYLHVPWQQVSGLTRMEFTNLVDSQGLGIVDILEFLGAMGLTPRLPWSCLPPIEQWEEYTNKILELDLLNLEPSKPLWWSVIDTGNPVADSSRRRIDHLIDSSMATVFVSREDLDYIQTKVRRIEKFIRDFNDNKREVAKLKNDLQNVTEAEERKAESNRRREEEENEQRRLKQEAGLALVMNESGTKRSIFGNRNRVEFSQFGKPCEDELVAYFDTHRNIEEKEVMFRQFAKSKGLSVFAADRIRRLFDKHTSGGRVDEVSFIKIVDELVDVDLPTTKLRQYWLAASAGGTESLDLFGFISWFITLNL